MNADKKLTHQEVNNASHTGEISPAAPNYFIGLDVGGSHVSANKLGNMPQDAIHATLESHNPATSIINTISAVIKKFAVQDTDTIAVGIAIPGPFNYEKGISEIHGVGGKFSNAFGLNIAEALKTFAQLPPGSEIHFANDAHCFATGAYHLLKLQSNRSICITLGTGFGSAFLQNGKLIQEHENIPASGAFYCEPFKKSIADDYFSSRWLLNEYKSITGENIESVKKLAALTDKEQQAKNIFETFGENMADFLAVWLKKYDCDTLVLGGNISKALLQKIAIVRFWFARIQKNVLLPELHCWQKKKQPQLIKWQKSIHLERHHKRYFHFAIIIHKKGTIYSLRFNYHMVKLKQDLMN
jgi:predicted NBD/HSP70 family sugar kinase